LIDLCVAVESSASEGLQASSSFAVASSGNEARPGAQFDDDKSMLSLHVDSRYRPAFKRVNNATSVSGASAKELRADADVDEQAEELPGRIVTKDVQERAAAGPGSGRLGALVGPDHRRMPYPGAPRSMVGVGGSGWLDVDDQLPPYVVTLSRYPRLYTTRGGRLVPAVWPRRTFARPRLHGELSGTNHTAATTSATTTAARLDSPSTTTPPPSATTTTTSLTATTTTTTTTTTKLTTTTTTDGETGRELAAAVHDTRQLAASSSDDKKLSLDVGAPEIGEWLSARERCCSYYEKN